MPRSDNSPVPYDEEEDAEMDGENANKVVNEEYKIWKKNAPYLYDTLITHALDWPTLTCEWFPDTECPPDKPYSISRLLLGTHTSRQSKDYLQIATVHIPKRVSSTSDSLSRENYDEDSGELHTTSAGPAPRIQITQRMLHDGEINRARYMPQNPNILATKSVSGRVFIYDRTKHPSEPDSDAMRPDVTLVGQTMEGYGLGWSKCWEGHVLSSGEDTTVCHWDVQAGYSKSGSGVEPVDVFRGHGRVQDVSWHATHQNVFASVGDDKQLFISNVPSTAPPNELKLKNTSWDTRDPARTKPKQRVTAHDREILAVSFCPSNENLILTGSSDKTIGIWDTRTFRTALHSLESHRDEVLQLSWSPTSPTVLASASSDRRVHIWDLSRIGEEQSPDDAEDGPPELMFIHGGHTGRPTDVCWCPGPVDASKAEGGKGGGGGELSGWEVASAAEDNVLMVWSMSANIWAGEGKTVDEEELEVEDD
ncbi:Histone acetyltransferase type B subunit 2 [Rhizoctonia solani]|uniref:Histone acetyltransferase type B subunit 2 n=1 Tax=Rhizoctonia solani TaxID=456999 RepID=A0A8H7M3N5_9AGAM|nr:Histone acetyltransferase type B subunit 2 [Rhizoctonia solani]